MTFRRWAREIHQVHLENVLRVIFTFTKQFNVLFMLTSICHGGVHLSNQVVGDGQDDDEPACCWETFLDSFSRICPRLGRTERVDHQSLPRSRSSRVIAKGLRCVLMTLVRGATQRVSTPPTPPESQRSPSITSMQWSWTKLAWSTLFYVTLRNGS